MGRALHLMTETVTVAAVTGRTAGGGFTYGTQSTVKAMVEYGSFKVLDDDGVEKVARHKVFTETAIAIRSRLWLPDDDATDNDAARHIMGIKKYRTPDGYMLSETFL